MAYVFTPPPCPAAAIAGSADTFPVRRIICIGRNYEAHAREMGSNPDREAPFFFTKWADDLVANHATIPYPPETANYHFEAELVIAIGKEGAKVSEAQALDLVFGYATGLDMTRRDLQLDAREKGRPWDTGKNFSHSAPLAAIRPVREGHVSSGSIRLTVNGAVRQDADVSDLIWNCAEQIAYVSRFPTEPVARARALEMTLTIAADIHPINNLRILKYLQTELGQDKDAVDGWYRHWVEQGFATLEQLLLDTRFAGGDVPNIVDACLVPQMYNARRFNVDLSPFPRVSAIADRAAALPAFAAAAPPPL